MGLQSMLSHTPHTHTVLYIYLFIIIFLVGWEWWEIMLRGCSNMGEHMLSMKLSALSIIYTPWYRFAEKTKQSAMYVCHLEQDMYVCVILNKTCMCVSS